MILIDTDIMIDILRGYTPAIDWLASLSDEEILLPGFVSEDLRFLSDPKVLLPAGLHACAEEPTRTHRDRYFGQFLRV